MRLGSKMEFGSERANIIERSVHRLPKVERDKKGRILKSKRLQGQVSDYGELKSAAPRRDAGPRATVIARILNQN